MPIGCSLGSGLGDLQGNHFTIVLRDVALGSTSGVLVEGEELISGSSALLERVQLAAEKLRVEGFVNYFGEQRPWPPGLQRP